ncbi:MAG: precorrin-8X methylmutase, partial [Firmicutes bacterium]|nr:precorrin-8X methylmutase [Bacillota bacterium]
MNIIWNPQEIERQSMLIIESYLQGYDFTPIEKAVVKRVIHTTGDPEIIGHIKFHPDAIQAGLEAMQRGENIYTDVNMLKAGINRKKLRSYGGEIFCSIAEPEIGAAAQDWQITRAAASMRLLAQRLDGAVVAIGNAPTALFEVMDMIEKGIARPALIIGTPVGFVGAAESKELMVAKNLVPYITV